MTFMIFGKRVHLYTFQEIKLKIRRNKIKSKLEKKGVLMNDIAVLTGRSRSLVSNVIAGRRRAKVIEKAINSATGIEFFTHK